MAPVLSAQRSFTLPDALAALLHRRRGEWDLQAACVRLPCRDEPTPFRVHWPTACDLRVNGTPVPRVYARQASVRLGPKARDEPCSVGAYCVAGRNAVSIAAADGRKFCLRVALARRRSDA